ncbi:helix-turn-helix transcriptional regulator [Salmonella enterica subsp. enterica serovar Napoli]|nr:AraC family transcriptional regulator [Salmonella enterica subsp. enterica serovar Napoli]ECP2608825.1 helix-turn-helix transcriptional regulator [Salmonella enterica]ECY8074449.1 helix-turn-helix transcriptional regulator [Salmonella enterica subsp. enterica serovar Vitkin]EDQ2740011.1 helix-turn-helix transcriptional regulator [Salmonella enterica subsp. enterica serovar Zaiman]EDR3237688.1 helix-turn-helix transcriptional regulator [Salmonella enterica subsp. enterica]EDW4662326.1 helix-
MKDIYSEILKSSCVLTGVSVCDLPVMLMTEHNKAEDEAYSDIVLYCVLSGEVSIVFNKNEVKNVKEGGIVFIKKCYEDKFIIFETNRAVVMKATLIPNGIYRDIITCCDDGNRLRILDNNPMEVSSCIVALSQLLLRLCCDMTEERGLLESSIALFFTQLYIGNHRDISLPFYGCDHPMSRLMVRILKNPEYPWKVKELAQEHHMSVNGFINEFRKFSGLTPLGFVQQTRLNKGKLKLENSNMPVALIAKECGYNSHASFTFYIRKVFGKPPLRIREDARKNICD